MAEASCATTAVLLAPIDGSRHRAVACPVAMAARGTASGTGGTEVDDGGR